MGRLEDEINDLFKDERIDFGDLKDFSIIDMRDLEYLEWMRKYFNNEINDEDI